MEPNAIAALVSNFISGFAMTWLRGYHWWGEGPTYILALLGGVLITGLTAKTAHGTASIGVGTWIVDTMTYTLVVIGSVKVGGDVARARANTAIPAAVMPQFSEISKEIVKAKEEDKP